jgi:hypothetical protein
MASGLTWYCRPACRRVDKYVRGHVAPTDLFAAVMSGRARIVAHRWELRD